MSGLGGKERFLMTDVAVQRMGNFPSCQVLFIIIWTVGRVGGVGGVGYTQTGMGSGWLFV